jgi:tryptophan 7-halogenase
MTKPIKKIVIVGGGAAGWLSAAIIAAELLLQKSTGIELVVIESPDIAALGVGEGTWPSMRNTLKKIGVSESDFIRACDASFKQGSKFIGWGLGGDDYYYHPFSMPERFTEINLADYWFEHRAEQSFSDSVCPLGKLSDNFLAPKLITSPEYSGVANYGYHLDAGKFSNFLKKHCLEKLGVTHISANVIAVNEDNCGDIASLATDQHSTLAGDLFIDCTGFSALLIGKHYGVPLRKQRTVLFNDTALAVQVPHVTATAAIASCTVSSAQTSGWVWDIGLPHRRGVGHVYSSAHTTQEQAELELRNYLMRSSSPEEVAQLAVRKINFEPGYREKFWHNNCVAIGVSAGFIEPLEASALVLIELSAQMIAEELPATRAVMNVSAKRFNRKFQYRWEKIIDFLKLHYVLSNRADSPYWLDHRHPDSIPESLQEDLIRWGYRSPWVCDTLHLDEMFPAASYQYVLFGMRQEAQYQNYRPRRLPTELAMAEKLFAENLQKSSILSARLPTNRELLTKLQTLSFQKI